MIDKTKTVVQARIAIVNAYTLIAAIYCTASAILFYYVVQHIFLSAVHLLALISIITNYLILIQTKNFNRATNIILATGTVVVVSLFATGGWANTGYLWPFAYLPFVFFLAERNVIINWVVALFAGCLIVTILHFAGAIIIPYSTIAIANFFAALLIFNLCIFLFQNATVKREEFLSYTESLLEAAPDAVIVINDEGKIVKWNPKSEILFGWSSAEVLGKLLGETIIPLRYREMHMKGLKHFLQTGEGPVLGKTIEIQAINKNNIEFDVALSISPSIVNGKHLFIGFIRDITERKKAEEKLVLVNKELESYISQLKESEEKLSILFNSIDEGFCIIQMIFDEQKKPVDYRFLVINPSFEKQTGLHDATGKRMREFAPNHEEHWFETYGRIAETGESIRFENRAEQLHRWYDVYAFRFGDPKNLQVAILFNDITERKKTEETIQQMNLELEKRVEEKTKEIGLSEKKYRNLFENNPMPMWVLEISTFKFLDVNEAATLHYGYSREEFLSLTAFDIRPEEEKERYKNADHSKSIYPANYNRGVWKHLKKDGTIIFAEIIVHEIIFENKTARLVLSNDITEKIKAEEKLKKTIKEITDYKFALDESSIVAITDQKGIIKHANDNFCKISKYSREELIGQDHRIINSGYHPKEFIRHLWVTIANGKIWKGELKNKAKDGTIYWVDTTIIPFLDEAGKPYQYVAIRADITERKHAEEALSESRQFLTAIMDNSTAVIYVKNLQGQYLLVNHRFTELFHLSEEAVLGKTDYDFFAKEDADAYRQMDVRTAAAENALTEEEIVPQDDGPHTYISVKSTLRNAAGKPYAIFGISTDITGRKKAEKEIQKLNEELEQKVIDRTAELRTANNELESFSYSVSHDLRAPLRIIDGYATILINDYKKILDEEGNRILGIVKTNAKRMGQLIDDLLHLSQTGRKELVMHFTDMNQLVRSVIDEQLSLSGNMAMITTDKLEPVECDSSLVRQVWTNIIANAIKYSSKQREPRIQISSIRKKDEVVYSVKDNGIGFDMKYADKLFGVFQRLHAISDFEGTGIGLALVQRILIRHKGKIWAESEPGKGAVFYFSLPVKF